MFVVKSIAGAGVGREQKKGVLIRPAGSKNDDIGLRFDSLLDVYKPDNQMESILIDKITQNNGKHHAVGAGTAFDVSAEWTDIQDDCGYTSVYLKVRYKDHAEGEYGFRFCGQLLGAGEPTWMIPGVFYKNNSFEQNTRKYPRYSRENVNSEKMMSNYWSFRSDRAALPAIFAWNDDVCGALCVEEQSAVGMTGVGFQREDGKTDIWINFPYREEPVTFVGEPVPDPADVTYYAFQPGEEVELHFKVYIGSPDLHSYDPFVRQMYKLHQQENDLNPWMGLQEAAEHTACGLYNWHYMPEHQILNETAAFDRELNNNVKGMGDRPHMHVGWVSGVPYAYALLKYGRKKDKKAYIDAAVGVLDNIASALAPSGLFWASWVLGKGWGTGWNPKSDWLQARTISEATLFMTRALSMEKERGVSHPSWEKAVRSNLDFAQTIQRNDGNLGSYYDCNSGTVEEWDGAAGILWIAALLEGYNFFQKEEYSKVADKAGDYYSKFILDEYIYGAPEDVHLTPTSEDAYNAVVAYVLLYEVSYDKKWLKLAVLAADWMMTFRWSYNLNFPDNTFLKQYDFRSRGADQASPSNQHLHNYGLFCVPEMLRLWNYTHDAYYLERTRDNLLCFLQFIARKDGDFNAYRGMVTERFYNTNCFQPKGMMLTLSHSWCVGLVLYACQEALPYAEDLKIDSYIES
ncbi:hypothetical protein EV207_11076 [Scopulibacillus darangshiensis]|uniref:Uncharacterized protein n=1 Tax=Scopulibacillus darangshiensis TaxID=442528 RepID=A0A4R2P6M9_9BACL|nr:hypothetical protein [Scopulibacillus darangshiensis]TCP29455.1 hypothetical protein EV207_11076 [Scopulibacillus darangshiensis]